MAITLFNPTDDDFKAQYGGVTFVIPKVPEDGHMVRVEDNKGNHILNQLGPRGLTSLDYGDEEEVKKKKAEDGRRRNIEFKRNQIVRYNRDNEARKATQRQYVDPPDFIKEWAKDLGVGLVAPYEAADIKNEEIAKLREETKKKDDQINQLTTQVQELIDLVQKQLPNMEKPQTEDEKFKEDIKRSKSEINAMEKADFIAWVKEIKQDEYGVYPIEIQEFIRKRWEGFLDKKEAAFPY